MPLTRSFKRLVHDHAAAHPAFAAALERGKTNSITAADCCSPGSQRARSGDADRAALIARAFRLEWFTVARMMVEAALAITSGALAHRISLTPFGLVRLIQLPPPRVPA